MSAAVDGRCGQWLFITGSPEDAGRTAALSRPFAIPYHRYRAVIYIIILISINLYADKVVIFEQSQNERPEHAAIRDTLNNRHRCLAAPDFSGPAYCWTFLSIGAEKGNRTMVRRSNVTDF
jgi:hypothetical protein